MGSTEMGNVRAETEREEEKVQQREMGLVENSSSYQNKKKRMEHKEKKKKKMKMKMYYFMKRIVCMTSDDSVSAMKNPAAGGGFNVGAGKEDMDHLPSHLVVMVNGIIGSATDWRFAAKQFVKTHPNDVLVHCSEANSSILTFDGVDVMGSRLADEVSSVINDHPSLQKISFVGHSLGGLIARYAVAVLYQQESVRKSVNENGGIESNHKDELKGNIAGLEPMNFVTSATPHLGSRGHKQVPLFCGSHTLEKTASRASGLLGRTGKHLFLRDSENGKLPLLLRMSVDTDDLKFISALRSFKKRVAYANVRFDHIVGWSSSSLRRRSELPKLTKLEKNAKYPHVVNEEMPSNEIPREVPLEADAVAKRRTSAVEAETMIRGLTTLSWHRVDISFSGSMQRLFAHSTIQVQHRRMNSDGADVIQHMIDNFLL